MFIAQAEEAEDVATLLCLVIRRKGETVDLLIKKKWKCCLRASPPCRVGVCKRGVSTGVSVNQRQQRITEARRKTEDRVLPQAKEIWSQWNPLKDLKAEVWQYFSGALGFHKSLAHLPAWSYFSLEMNLPLAISFDFQRRYGLCAHTQPSSASHS